MSASPASTEVPPPSQMRGKLETIAVAARCAIGLLFLYMGLKKAMDPVAFLKLVHQYDMVHNAMLLNLIAACLPWFEAFCGLLLLAGVAVRGTALMLVGMLVPFTALVLKRALAIYSATHPASFCAIKFDCGCGMGEVFICSKVLENSFLILLSIWLLFGFGRRWAAKYNLLG
jgi:uncharacterized membrane protein YphA (DoxX/SURF4 family)